MKPLTEMNNRELFSVLAGSDVIQQAYLQKIVRTYLRHSEKEANHTDIDLMTIVKDYMDGKYGKEIETEAKQEQKQE